MNRINAVFLLAVLAAICFGVAAFTNLGKEDVEWVPAGLLCFALAWATHHAPK